MRFGWLTAAAGMLVAQAAEAKIADFTAIGAGPVTGVWTNPNCDNCWPFPPPGGWDKLIGRGASVRVSFMFSDGSDPQGAPELPSDYTGTINYTSAPPWAGYNSLLVSVFTGPYGISSGTTAAAFARGYVTLVNGIVTDFALDFSEDPAGGAIGMTWFNIQPYGGSMAFSGSWTMRAVPEPATWALMIVGFGAIGGAMRRKTLRQPVIRRV